MKIAYFDYWDDHFGPWLQGFRSYMEAKGHSVDVKMCRKDISDNVLITYDLVFIWNGAFLNTSYTKKRCGELGVPNYVLEVGWFPQKQFYFVDPNGINGHGSLISDDLNWVTDKMIKRVAKFSQRYLQGRKWDGSGGYILCPLQLEGDTNITRFSPFKKMQAAINYIERCFGDKPIIFKIHPKDIGGEKRYTVRDKKHKLVKSGSFLDFAQHAEKVVGINSTCLFESVMMRVPTISLGISYLTPHHHQPMKLLAAMIDKQIRVGKTDLDYWFADILKDAERKRK